MDRSPVRRASSRATRFRRTSSPSTVPVWDEARAGRVALEVGGLVKTPLRSRSPISRKLPRVGNARPLLRRGMDGGRRRGPACGVSELARLAGVQPDARVRRLPVVRRRLPRELGHRERDASADARSCTRRTATTSAPAYGAPARVYSPVKLGYKNTKYLTQDHVPAAAERRLLERPGLRVVRRRLSPAKHSALSKKLLTVCVRSRRFVSSHPNCFSPLRTASPHDSSRQGLAKTTVKNDANGHTYKALQVKRA